MPCRSDYLESTELERECTKVYQLIDEIITGTLVDPKKYGDGYDERAYNHATRKVLDTITDDLCTRLRILEGLKVDIKVYSPELQIWWRDHSEADKTRE